MQHYSIAAAVERARPEPQVRGEAPRLLTVAQAAAALGVSEMTVYRALRSRELAGIKIGGTYRVPRAFVERMLDAADAGQTVVAAEYAQAWGAESPATDSGVAS